MPPNTFYRVSVKAVVRDRQNRLLVFKNTAGEWEMPGGGWDHAETLEACVVRELHEEVRARVKKVGPPLFVYRGATAHNRPKISIAVSVTLTSFEFVPTDDDLNEARFVSQEEFLKLPFQQGEETVLSYVDTLWPPRFD